MSQATVDAIELPEWLVTPQRGEPSGGWVTTAESQAPTDAVYDYEFKGPFTVKAGFNAATIEDLDGQVVAHLLDVVACPAYAFALAAMRFVNREAETTTRALVALFEIGALIEELLEDSANQGNEALQAVAAVWEERAAALVNDEMSIELTAEGDQIVKARVDSGDLSATEGQA